MRLKIVNNLQGKVIWDNQMVSVICNLCIVEAETRHHLGTHFTKTGRKTWSKLLIKQLKKGIINVN